MIDTRGMVTVAEAAKRLNRSIEQVRRNLREGKLKGQRVGGQWFVDETSLKTDEAKEFRPLIPPDVNDRIDRLGARIMERWRREGREPIDVLEMLRESRENR